MAHVLMGKAAKAEDKELASAILAGEMKNAWEVENRPNQPDSRPSQLRAVRALPKSRSWYKNYDEIDWSK
jgi:hypothetical protein